MLADEFFARMEAEHPEILDIAHEVDPPIYLGWNVFQHRSRRGLTQAQLAELVGVAQPRIARIERGDANPRLTTIAKLAHALGVTVSELLVDGVRGERPAVRAAVSTPVARPQRKRRVG